MKIASLLLVVFSMVLGSPAASQQFQHNADPFEPCQTVKEVAEPGLTGYKCGEGYIDDVTLLVSFDLGTWSAAYDRFTIEGGRELEISGRTYPRVLGCRRRCTYFSTASINLPLDILFADKARAAGLYIKASGGPRAVMLHIEPRRIAALERALIKAEFIEAPMAEAVE